eukprot:7389761-Pyramimonas_sp.AAC.1
MMRVQRDSVGMEHDFLGARFGWHKTFWELYRDGTGPSANSIRKARDLLRTPRMVKGKDGPTGQTRGTYNTYWTLYRDGTGPSKKLYENGTGPTRNVTGMVPDLMGSKYRDGTETNANSIEMVQDRLGTV